MVKLFNLSHVNAFTALFILCYYHFLHLILSFGNILCRAVVNEILGINMRRELQIRRT